MKTPYYTIAALCAVLCSLVLLGTLRATDAFPASSAVDPLVTA